MSTDWLSNDRVFRLTKKKKYKAQCRRLSDMGIKFTPAADGEPLVSESFDAPPELRQKRARNVSNWEMHT